MSFGWSPIAVICVIIMVIVMVVLLIVVGFQKLKSNIPVAGSCSAAIAAACHQPDPSAAEKKLKWGVIWTRGGLKGHCAFSSGEVEEPDVDCVYA